MDNKTWRLLAIGLCSLIQLGVELILIKTTAYEFATLSLVVISLAMLGVAVAAPLTRVLGGPEKALRRSLVALPVAAFIVGCILACLEHQFLGGTVHTIRMFVVGTACLFLLALTSIPLYTHILLEPESTHRYYGAGFIGGALGAPTAYLFLHFGGDYVAFSSLSLLILVPVFLLMPQSRQRSIVIAMALVLGAGGFFLFPQIDRKVHHSYIFTKSNALSRIDVRRFPSHFWVLTAGINTGTATSDFELEGEGNPTREFIHHFPTTLGKKKVLIVASGAGKDLVSAIRDGAADLHAVEINGMIPEFMAKHENVKRDPYRDPRVTLHIGEGRDIVSRLNSVEKQRFDLIYVPFGTLFGSAGHVFTHSYLMTTEAFDEYGKTLNDDGVIAVSHVTAEWMSVKVTRALYDSLQRRGVENPAKHMFGIRGKRLFVLIGRPSRPFSEQEIAQWTQDYGFGEEVWNQNKHLSLAEPANTAEIMDIEGLLTSGAGIRKLTDDNPHFYNEELRAQKAYRDTRFYEWNIRAIKAIALVSLALILVVLVLVVVIYRKCAFSSVGYMGAFCLMGMAYTIYQTAVLQRLEFFIGHPTLTTLFVLTSALFASGLGSFSSKKYFEGKAPGPRIITLAVLFTALGFFSVVQPSWLIFPELHKSVKIILSVVIVMIPFFFMGTFFPVALHLLNEEQPEIIPWGWALNGIASITGTLTLMYLSMMLGFQKSMLLVVPLYGMLGLWEMLVKQGKGALAHKLTALVLSLVFVASGLMFL